MVFLALVCRTTFLLTSVSASSMRKLSSVYCYIRALILRSNSKHFLCVSPGIFLLCNTLFSFWNDFRVIFSHPFKTSPTYVSFCTLWFLTSIFRNWHLGLHTLVKLSSWVLVRYTMWTSLFGSRKFRRVYFVKDIGYGHMGKCPSFNPLPIIKYLTQDSDFILIVIKLWSSGSNMISYGLEFTN